MKHLIFSLSILFFAASATACDCQLNLSNTFFGTFSGTVEINGNIETGGAITLPAGPVTINYYNGTVGNAISIFCEGIHVYDSGILVTTADQTPLAEFNLASNCSNCPEFGMPCDDLNDCTINDMYNISCQCEGTFEDSDADGVCDVEDECPGQDDFADLDNNGTQDCLEVLPVDFTNYQIEIKDGANLHSWRVENQQTESYILQKKVNGRWESIAMQTATNNEVEVYSYLEFTPPEGWNYYRIVAVDADGQTTHSEIESIENNGEGNQIEMPVQFPEGIKGIKRI